MFSISYKVLVLLMLLSLVSQTSLLAQTWNELFSQEKTQKRYLLEQIAALQVFTGYLKKGYQIAGSGLETIRSLSNAELSLRRGYLSALRITSPVISANPKLREILTMQLGIDKMLNSLLGSDLTSDDRAYLTTVRGKIFDDCDADRQELAIILGVNIKMTDDQRIARIERIYQSSLDMLAFSQSLTGQVRLLVAQRKFGYQSLEHLFQLYGTQEN